MSTGFPRPTAARPSAQGVVRRRRRLWVGRREELLEGGYLKLAVLYAGKPSSVVVFRQDGIYRAYRNLCVHMPRELDCEVQTIFAPDGRRLRCSMHGIVYDARSGESRSTLCHGLQLTSVRLEEDDDGVWLFDKRVRSLPLP